MNLKVGRYCSIATGLKVFGSSHPVDRLTSSPVSYTSRHFSFFEEAGMNVSNNILPYQENNGGVVTKIGNDVWIGEDVLLKPGIEVGDGAIIGARSIVTKNVPPYAIVVGSPSKIVKYRFEKYIIDRLLAIKWWNYDFSGCDIVWNDVVRSLDLLEERIKRQAIQKLEFNVRDLSIDIVGSNVLA